MKNLKKRAELFFIRNRDKGIPNLMLYIAIGNALVYILSMIDPSKTVYSLLCFDKASILSGQVWRLFSFLLVPDLGGGIFGVLITFLFLFFLFRIGRLLEQTIGLCKFDLYYLTGVVILDVFGLLFNLGLSAGILNWSLLLTFAVAYPEGQVLLFYVIPLKVKYLAWFYAAITILNIILTRSFLPVIPILNFLLFFWSDIPRLFPARAYRAPRSKKPPVQKQSARPNPNWAERYESKSGQKPYHHKCTVCGRTDTEYPALEFRYCSKCQGYHCYCMDHINNHSHIQ